MQIKAEEKFEAFGTHEAKPPDDGDDPFREPAPWYQVFWRQFERGSDFLAWIHNACCFYICMIWLLPMIILIGIDFVIPIKQFFRGRIDQVLVWSLVALPIWLIISAYSKIAKSKIANRINWFEERATIAIGMLLILIGIGVWIAKIF